MIIYWKHLTSLRDIHTDITDGRELKMYESMVVFQIHMINTNRNENL
jgi:hypothetical protein